MSMRSSIRQWPEIEQSECGQPLILVGNDAEARKLVLTDKRYKPHNSQIHTKPHKGAEFITETILFHTERDINSFLEEY